MASSAKKDPKTGKWMIQYRFTDWRGIRKKSTKRGFCTKREAEAWLQKFLLTQQSDINMLFGDFIDVYYQDMSNRLREHTMQTKRYIIDIKILPYFAQKKINEITPVDVRKWQNELLKQNYKPTYIKTINNQLSAIFNYAEKYYNLPNNPARKAGSIGKSHAEEMQFWTKEEFTKFDDALINKRQSYIAFKVLYWTGMRLGELLALTISDIDFDNNMISITKSYQRIGKKDVITDPKTPNSKRKISVPKFLIADLEEYISSLYKPQKEARVFEITKYFLEHEMQRGIKKSGVKRIRIHDLRHSHASHLIHMGVPILEVSRRLGHQSPNITLGVYGHLYPDRQKKLADQLQKEYMENL